MLHDASVSLDMFGQDFSKKGPGRKIEKTYGTLTHIQGTKLWVFLVVLASGPPGGLYEQCCWGIFADLLAFWLDVLMFSSFSIISHWLFFDLLGVVIARYRKYP